jgi:hypothetical protein
MRAARFSPEEPPWGMLADMGDSRYREWSGQLLQHPDGRAADGKPCVKCGQLIQVNAAGQQRERHVCSSLLQRQTQTSARACAGSG